MEFRCPSSSYQCKEQPHQTAQRYKLTNSLDQLRNQNILCDVTLLIANRSFPAHKAVLAASSKYFHAMFTSGFQETNQDKIIIHGKSEIFDLLLTFVYTGKMSVTLENVLEVLEMSCYVQLKHASEACSAYLIRAFRGNKIKFEEALQVLCLIEWHSEFVELKEWCKQCISKNFIHIHEVLDYKQLVTADVLNGVLARSDIACTEEEVLTIVLIWLKKDLAHRKTHASNLLQKIRIGLIPADRLIDIIMNKLPELLSIPECCKIVEGVLTRQDIADVNLKNSVFATRTTISAFLIPGNQTYYLDEEAPGNIPQWNRLSRFPPIPTRKLHCYNTLAIGSQMYLAGGLVYNEPDSDSSDEESNYRHLKKYQASMYRYTAKDNIWQRLQDMTVPRSQSCLVEHGGRIYAIGGTSGTNDMAIKDVEYYSIVNKEWTVLAPLRLESYIGKASAVPFRGYLLVYAAQARRMNGGMKSVTHNLQVYDTQTESWNVVLTDKHNQGSNPSALLVHNNRCYRVVYGNCRCPSKNLGCRWHKVCIDEVLFSDNPTLSAAIGNSVDQDGMPDHHLVASFCIDGDVFVDVNDGTIHNTGDRITERHDVNLAKWEWSNTIGVENSIARLTFDKALLE